MNLSQFFCQLRRVFILSAVCVLPQAMLAQAQDLSTRILSASTYTIENDPALQEAVDSIAEGALAENCTACHGENLEGQIGVPNLVDFDWIWGVTGSEPNSVEPVMKIMQTILYGVRNIDCPDDIKSYGACPDTRFSQMPAYGVLGYTEQQVSDLTEYVISMSGGEADAEAVARSEPLQVVCTECHGAEGYGYKPYGGPDLRDDIWLFGGSREEIYDVIYNGRTESCPAWVDTLDPVTIKALAVYIYNKSFAF